MNISKLPPMCMISKTNIFFYERKIIKRKSEKRTRHVANLIAKTPMCMISKINIFYERKIIKRKQEKRSRHVTNLIAKTSFPDNRDHWQTDNSAESFTLPMM